MAPSSLCGFLLNSWCSDTHDREIESDTFLDRNKRPQIISLFSSSHVFPTLLLLHFSLCTVVTGLMLSLRFAEPAAVNQSRPRRRQRMPRLQSLPNQSRRWHQRHQSNPYCRKLLQSLLYPSRMPLTKPWRRELLL